jgi:hypothetical protein
MAILHVNKKNVKVDEPGFESTSLRLYSWSERPLKTTLMGTLNLGHLTTGYINFVLKM